MYLSLYLFDFLILNNGCMYLLQVDHEYTPDNYYIHFHTEQHICRELSYSHKMMEDMHVLLLQQHCICPYKYRITIIMHSVILLDIYTNDTVVVKISFVVQV